MTPSTKPLQTPSTNVLVPQGLSDAQVSLLIQGGTKKSYPKKKQLRFPSPRLKAKRGADTYLFSVSKHLNQMAMRMLNQEKRLVLSRDPITHRVPWEKPFTTLTEEQLSDRLYAYVQAKAGQHIVYDYYEPHQPGDGFYRLIDSRLCEACDEVAREVLEAWEPSFTEKLSAAGRKGGRISKRGPKYTPDLLDGLDHLSIKQQSLKLGISEATVSRLRAQRTSLN